MNSDLALWELTSELRQLSSALEAVCAEEELSEQQQQELLQALADKYLQAESDFDHKALQIARLINYRGQVNLARKNEIERLKKLHNTSQKGIEQLKKYLVYQMTTTDKLSIEGTSHSLSLRKKPPSLVIHCNTEDLPEEFIRATKNPDKVALRDACKKEKLPFAELVDTNEFSLVIK